MISKWMDLAVKIALDAVRTVSVDANGRKEIDIKRFARIEKVNESRLGSHFFDNTNSVSRSQAELSMILALSKESF